MAPEAKIYLLNIEVRFAAGVEFPRPDAIADEILTWVHRYFSVVQVGQVLQGCIELRGAYVAKCRLPWKNKSLRDAIRSVHVVDATKLMSTGNVLPLTWVKLEHAKVKIQQYFLLPNDTFALPSPDMRTEERIHVEVQFLPNRELHGLYESLVYRDNVHFSLLRELECGLRLVKEPDIDKTLVAWSGLILLHGPPGTGKTTLARALAQKLSIRLFDIYPKTSLLEIGDDSVFSKWFGESSKHMGRLFDRVKYFAQTPKSLVIVLVDEVESLAGSRMKASEANEVGDSIRATNTLLRKLDELRKIPNVLVICTTNFLDALDLAFYDRCDVVREINTPDADAAYAILRSVYNELLDKAIVVMSHEHGKPDGQGSGNVPPQVNLVRVNDPPGIVPRHEPDNSAEPLTEIPDLNYAMSNPGPHQSAMPSRLHYIAQCAAGMSGRKLRSLPVSVLTQNGAMKCTIDEALSMLEKALHIERETTPDDFGGLERSFSA